MTTTSFPYHLPDADTIPGCVLRPGLASLPPLNVVSPTTDSTGIPVHAGAAAGVHCPTVGSCGGLITRRLPFSDRGGRDAATTVHDHTAGAVVRMSRHRVCSAALWIAAGLSSARSGHPHDGITSSAHNHSMRGGSKHLAQGSCPRIEVIHQEGCLSSSPGTVPDIQRKGADDASKFGKAGSEMNGPRLTAMVVETAEELNDRWGAARADGVICPREIVELTVLCGEVYAVSMDADEAIGLTVTMLRRGPESPSLKRRMVERGIRLASGADDEQTAA